MKGRSILRVFVAGSLALLIATCSFAQSTSASLFPVYLNGKGGFIDKKGVVVIEPQFDEVKEFSEGLAAVKVGDNWGYINTSGELVISARHHNAWPFSGGIARVLSGRYGFIDKKGSFVVKPEFDWAYTLSDGLARAGVGGAGGSPAPGIFREPHWPYKWVFFDSNGKVVLRPAFDYVGDFHGGLAVVGKRAEQSVLLNYIDKQGKLVFEDWFIAAFPFSEGLAIVSNDPNGFTSETQTSVMFDNFDENPNFTGRTKPIQFMLVDENGKRIPLTHVEDINDFHDGFAAVQINGKWGYIDQQGRIAIDPQFDEARDFSEQLAFVIKGQKRCFIDKSGSCVVSVNYDRAGKFQNGLAKILDSDRTGYIDKSGKVIWKPTK